MSEPALSADDVPALRVPASAPPCVAAPLDVPHRAAWRARLTSHAAWADAVRDLEMHFAMHGTRSMIKKAHWYDAAKPAWRCTIGLAGHNIAIVG